jgi:hypothetical protein
MTSFVSPSAQRQVKAAEGWLELGEWLSANAELEEIDAQERAHPHVLALRVRIYASAGKWQEALVVGGSVAELPDPELQLALARCACQVRDSKRARVWAGQAINLDQSSEFNLRLLDDPHSAVLWE